MALDCETTGVDLKHGAKPFFVTTCVDGEAPVFWEWPVDPLTRQPQIPPGDIEEIRAAVGPLGPPLVGQNLKFDVRALLTIGIDIQHWHRIDDTLRAGHVLASSMPHDLTSMALQYLGVDILPYERALEVATKEARRVVQQAQLRQTRGGNSLFDAEPFAGWAIAKKGRADMPSAKEETWKYDSWLPRAVAQELDYPKGHPWWTVLRDYANTDSIITARLWQEMRRQMERRGLLKIYRECMRVYPVVVDMEERGVTGSEAGFTRLRSEFRQNSLLAGGNCVRIAKSRGFDLELPKGAINGSIRQFAFDVLNLPRIRNGKAKTDNPSLDSKNAIPYYLANLEPGSQELDWIQNLVEKRTKDTALAYLESYERFRVPDVEGYWRLHPSLNPTGTDTLRCSSGNPNAQQISKKEKANLRKAFGPAAGREWWSFDASNIELRLPAYEAKARKLMDLFDRPDEPPFYGMVHMLMFSIVYEDIWSKELKEHGPLKVAKLIKTKYESTYYQDCKNGDFAVQYGSVESSGTADRTYRRPGAFRLVKQHLSEIHGPGGLNERCIAYAQRHGYVETMPDKTVDPTRGYPLLCTRSERGYILPTVPLNYRVQGTACWWMMKAMIRVHQLLAEWRKTFDAYICLQVHDELVLDMPKRADPRKNPKASNLARARMIQALMASGGDDIGVPTPVSMEWHENNWAEGVAL